MRYRTTRDMSYVTSGTSGDFDNNAEAGSTGGGILGSPLASGWLGVFSFWAFLRNREERKLLF